MDEYGSVTMHTMDVSSLEEFAEKYPEEYDAYIDDMAEIYGHEEPIDYPEDWAV